MIPWWRLGWEQGNKGRKVNPTTQVNPPTPPDHQQGKFDSVMLVLWYVPRLFNCAACCLRLFDVVSALSGSLQ